MRKYKQDMQRTETMIASMLSLQRRKILIDSEIRKEPSDDRRLFNLLSRDKNMVYCDKS